MISRMLFCPALFSECWCTADATGDHDHNHDDGRMEVVVIVRADMPETAAGTNVVVRVPMPRNAVSVHSDVRPYGTAASSGVR